MPINAAIDGAMQQQSTVDFLWWTWATDKFAAWGQWAGGIGAIAAVIVTLWIMRRDRRKHQGEIAQAARAAVAVREAELAAAEEVRAARARTVVAGLGMWQRVFTTAGGPRTSPQLPAVKISNHCTTPVLEVILEDVVLTTLDGRVYPEWEEMEATTYIEPEDGALTVQFADVIGPGESKVQLYPWLRNFEDKLLSGEVQLRARFTFLDVEGYRWRRDGLDAPVRIHEAEADWKGARSASDGG